MTDDRTVPYRYHRCRRCTGYLGTDCIADVCGGCYRAIARADDLARIRADRLRRGGKPENPEASARRDAIASMALAGVDARPWLGGER